VTVLTLPGPDSQARPVQWRRMVWVIWRQHRATLISVPAVLGAFAVFLLIMGLKIHHDYTAMANCRPVTSGACHRLNRSFNSTDWPIANGLDIFMNLLPVLFGAFVGAPLLARELEHGTFRYAWTQGIGRTRWTIAKLTGIAVVLVALMGAFGELFAWFFQPILSEQGMTVLAQTVFVTHGIAFPAWALIAFSLAAFFGMLLRRIVPAMAVTFGVYLGLQLLEWLVLLKHYLPPLVSDNPRLFSGQSSTSSPWVLNTWTTGKTHWWRYIPVSRFWPMQFVEGAWLLALSLLLAAATLWLVRRRAA
jgi:ABC-type transport system involved in multi-copper enzyme maturation permease subunit